MNAMNSKLGEEEVLDFFGFKYFNPCKFKRPITSLKMLYGGDQRSLL
jgi:hypothetical protein